MMPQLKLGAQQQLLLIQNQHQLSQLQWAPFQA